MSDKDQFTFEEEDDFPETKPGAQDDPDLKFDFSDDDEEFPETDLSAAFSDGEVEAENPVAEDPEPEQAKSLFGKKAGKPKKEKKAKQAKAKQPKREKGGGGSGSRLVLMLLLLVVAAGAGAYYFMGLGETTPSVPTATAPAKQPSKAVALPPKPAPAEAPEKATVKAPVPPKPAPAKPAPKPATEPPKPATAKAPAPPKPAAAKAPAPPKPVAAAVKEPVKPAPKPAPAKPQPAQQVVAAKTVAAPAPKPAAVAKKPAATAKPAPSPVQQTPGGAYALDAGSYLYESNRTALVAKIKKLGYEPLVTPVDATLDMVRLRVGTFSKGEVQEALDYARAIEPGSYSAPAGDSYVIYAGTFLKTGNVDRLIKRFLDEGIKISSEPVEVVRTLSRIRFGSFASKEDAAAAAQAVAKDGVKAAVVKSR